MIAVLFVHSENYYGIRLGEVNPFICGFYVNAFFMISGYLLFKKQLGLSAIGADCAQYATGGADGAVVKGNFAYAASKNADIIITACRTRGESINEVYTQEKNLNIKAEWFRKSYEYHLCQDTLELCNQEFARVMFDALSK